MRAALKVMPPILLCCSAMSVADVAGMAVGVKPSHLYSILLSCGRWQQRGSLTKLHLVWKHIWRKAMSLNSSLWKKIASIEWIWLQWGDGWCVPAVATVTVVDHCWHRFFKHSMQTLVHHWWKCAANGRDCAEKLCFVAENLLYQIVLLCSVYLL